MEKVRDELQRLIKRFTGAHGKDSYEALRCRFWLIKVMLAQDLTNEAAAESAVLLTVLESSYGAAHPLTRRTKETLGLIGHLAS